MVTDRPAQLLLSPIYDNLRQIFRAHNLTSAKPHGHENYESVRNITILSQLHQHHRHHARRRGQCRLETLNECAIC
jgi:hypothetical protein